MDALFDPWKNFSLGIFGSAPEIFHRAHPLTLNQLDSQSLPDFFLLGPNCTQEEIKEIVGALKTKGIFESRIIRVGLSHSDQKIDLSFASTFPICLTENSEDTKTRFALHLEKQRWKLLNEFLHKRQKGQAENSRPNDAIFFLHSFCLSMGLKLQEHQNTFEKIESPIQDLSPHELTDLLTLLALEIVNRISRPAEAREFLKLHTSQLPFRLRTEVRATVEKTLERLWKGTSNAA